MASQDLEEELATLTALPLAQLRDRWREVSDMPLPKVSAALLRLAIAWELQAAAYGGLSRQTQQTLDQLTRGRTQTRTIQPGMRLVREWNGTLHSVTISEDGDIVWNERKWNSLSAVARAITGTRWSGPAFFGLKARQAA